MLKISENLTYGKKISKNPKFWFWSKLSKMSILVNIFENIDFGEKFPKHIDFGQNCYNLDFGQNHQKMLILVKIYENPDFG